MAKKITKKSAKKKVVKKKTTKKSSAKKVVKKKTAKKSVTKKIAKKVTKKKVAKKAPAKKAVVKKAPAKKAAKPARIKKVKTPLSVKELRHYRELLISRRAVIMIDMDSMSKEALKNNDSANLSHVPLHMADVGTDNYEQELMLGLVESERNMVSQINEAIIRIQEKTYGVCEATGKIIAKPRLDAKPWAKYCIEHARELESNGGRL